MRKTLFSGTKRWVTIVSATLLSSVLLAACGENSPSIFNTAGPVAGQELTLFYLILAIATIIFVIVEGLLIYSIVRYRERPNSPNPTQIHGNNKIEVIWTVIPSFFLFIVLGATIITMFGLTNLGAGQKIEVKVIGHQWWWEFDYPSFHIVTADSLHIPKGAIIQADLVSNNVIHSFWVPALTGKKDVIPGHNNQLLFRADTVGTYPGECAEFCGSQHAHMHFDVVVDSQDGFNTWMSSQQQAAQTPTDTLAAAGAKTFMGTCIGCHGIVGVNLTSFNDPKANGLIGPNLTHFGSRTLIAGGVLPNDPAHLAQWLHNPQDVKPGNDMPNLGLSQDQINGLVAYLESLK